LSKGKINMIVGRSLLVLLITGTFVLLIGAVRSKESKVCTGVDIQIGITQQKGFIEEKQIASVINDAINRKPKGTPLKTFDLRQIEKLLEENVWIKKTQMFFDNNKLLHVEIEQRIPVARIIDKSGASYYLDSTGFTLPLSNTDRADVPVFTNIPMKRSARLQHTLLEMANVINSDSFWLAQAAQINWLPRDKFELYPAFGNHVVDLGDAQNAADKFGRLKLFYQKVSAKKGFDAYPVISVAFGRQVLATKAAVAMPAVDAGKAMQVFDQMVKTNRRTANDEKEQEEIKRKMTRDVITSRPNPVPDKPPDIKNKGNPTPTNEKTSATPKAVMPRLNHN
jgi:cell division protein FtsQ